MGLYIRQDDNRTELQNRLATELQEKAKQRAKLADRPDGVDDSQYIVGTKSTTSLAWVWAILVAVAAGIIIWLLATSATQ